MSYSRLFRRQAHGRIVVGTRRLSSNNGRGLIGEPSTFEAAQDDWQEVGWERLLLDRGWLCPSAYGAAPADEQPAMVSRLSRRLSFPLTLAHAWKALGIRASAGRRPHICVLGAREECDEGGGVPISAWLELCVHSQSPKVTLSMIGPEAHGSARALEAGKFSIRQAAPCSSAFSESAVGRALMSESSSRAASTSAEVAASVEKAAAAKKSGRASAAARAAVASASVAQATKYSSEGASFEADDGSLPDAFALFNPGLHAGKYTWKPSVRAVLASGRPLLLTAYQEQDAASDAQWLTAEMGLPPTCYEANPWASLEPWAYDSRLAHDAHANMFFAVLNGRGPKDAAGHGGRRRAPRSSVVPTEQGWARRNAWQEMFSEGGNVAREMVDVIGDAFGRKRA